MTARQRRLLRQVVLQAGNRVEVDWFSCISLRDCFRGAFVARRCDEEHAFTDAYWRQTMGGECGEVVEDRLNFPAATAALSGATQRWRKCKREARQVRLMMLAMLHTLIGSGDFEDMTSYRPGF